MFSTCSLELSKSKLFVPSQYKWSEVAQSYLTLCNPMDCRPPGSSIHGIFQGRILEWVAISFSRRSSRPRDWTQVSHIVADALPSEPPGNSSQYKDVYILIFYIFLTLQNMLVPSRSKLQVEKKIFFHSPQVQEMIQNRNKCETYKEWISPQHCLQPLMSTLCSVAHSEKSFLNGHW